MVDIAVRSEMYPCDIPGAFDAEFHIGDMLGLERLIFDRNVGIARTGAIRVTRPVIDKWAGGNLGSQTEIPAEGAEMRA